MSYAERRGWPRAALVLAAALAALVLAAAADAQAASFRECAMSVRDQNPPGRTPAYDLHVQARRVPCALAKRVMRAFHACRTPSGSRCARPLLGGWRCAATRRDVDFYLFGSFACTSRGRTARGTYHQDEPACFGAAARDPLLPCRNAVRSLPRGSPEPDPLAGCDNRHPSGACASGALAPNPARYVAIVGDSHVNHWLAPLNVVAAVLNWRVYSHAAGGCFFSAVAKQFLDGCESFYEGTARWFADHPEIDTVFVTQNADTPVSVERGQTIFDVKVDGFRRAWVQRLPASVEHVIVLRDTTISTYETMDCVAQASADATKPLATACPLARSIALRPDPAVEAVRRLHSPRYAAIDLSHYLCGPRECYPVVGGALVNGDVWGHLNTVFARTLGPYLLRALRPLMARW